MMKKIMVTGGTGGLGGQALKFLLRRTEASSLSAVVRGDVSRLDDFKRQGVTIIQADYGDKESLEKAFQGIDALYFVSSNDLEKRLKQHENVVNAAKEAGVKHVVFTSFQRKTETSNSPIAPIAEVYLQTEKWLKASGLTYTFLKHALYSDVIPMFIGDKVLENGIVYQPAGDGKASYASRSDMAEAASVILTTGGHENKTYEISGPKSYSYHDVAEILSEISGKQISYVSPPVDEFKKTMADAGVPQEMVSLVAMFCEGIKQGEFDLPDPTLIQLLGREPESLAEFLKKVYA